jgi:HK97 family phage major capsid protein
MAVTAKELREKRSKVFTRIREMTDKIQAEGRDFTAEEKPNYEAANKEYDGLSTQIEVAERVETLASEQRESTATGRERRRDERRQSPGMEDRDTGQEEEEAQRREEGMELTDAELGIETRQLKPEVFALALQGWMRRQSGHDIEARHKKAAHLAGVNLRKREFTINLASTGEVRKMTREFRATAMSAIDLSGGATFVAPGFVDTFERAMLAFGGMRQVSQVIRTDTGSDMPWPTANDTTNKGHIVGENVAVAQTPVSTGAMRLGAYKYTSDELLVPVELLDDSAFDLATFIAEVAGERIGRRQNDDFTTGDAAGKPKGIVTAATLGVTAAGATAITADEIVGLIHSVDPAYRNDPSFGLMMHDQVLLYVRKLKDSQNRYLFQDAAAGAPPTIWGCKYTINQSMASSVATTLKTMLAGALSKYKIRDVKTLRLRRLVERRADSDQESFIAFQRSDGNLLDAGVAPAKYLQQA